MTWKCSFLKYGAPLGDPSGRRNSAIILNETDNFYSDLYDEKEGIEINESTCPFVGNHSFIPDPPGPSRRIQVRSSSSNTKKNL